MTINLQPHVLQWPRHRARLSEDELSRKLGVIPYVVGQDFRHTTTHGAIEGKTQTNTVKFYNLRAIIAVGYRVNST